MIQEVLVNYRQRSTSLQANNTKTPWDWYEALKAIRDKLKELDLYDTVETSFKNLAFGVSIYNMCSLKAGEAFCQIYERLNNEIFAEFDLDDFTESVPAFICIIMIPMAYSISDGIVLGLISYVLTNLLSGKFKKISLTMYILAALFTLKYLV